MTVPAEFNNNWDSFVTEFYAGFPPTFSTCVGTRALNAIQQFFPEAIERLQNSTFLGPMSVDPLLEFGLILETCRELPGFNSVLARVRNGEKSAESELVFAAALVKMGLEIELEPYNHGKRPDLSIATSGTKVFLEVINPETSDIISDGNSIIQSLANDILQLKRHGNFTISLLRIPSNEEIIKIINIAASMEDGSSSKQHIENVAIVELKQSSFPIALPLPPESFSAPTIICSSTTFGGEAAQTQVNIQLQISDERAQRLMSDEAKHFVKGECNVLVCDLTKIGTAKRPWIELIRRRFQPHQNTRFSAVFLFSRYIGEQGLHWQSTLLVNQHAVVPLPNQLFELFERLDRYQFSKCFDA